MWAIGLCTRVLAFLGVLPFALAGCGARQAP
jgi:hypothetical protein